MTTVIIQGKSEEDIDLVLRMAVKLGLKTSKLSVSEMEDMAIGEKIKAGMKSGKAKRADVMKALGR
jgi:hypothetical protein